MLARQVEIHKADVIDSASVLYVYVPDNRGLRRVIVPEFREIGKDVFEVWERLLIDRDRFFPVAVRCPFYHAIQNLSPTFNSWATFLQDRYGSIFPRS